MPRTRGRGAGEDEHNPKGAVDAAAARYRWSHLAFRAVCLERGLYGSGSGGWKRTIFMKPSERTLRGQKKQWHLAGRRLHCGQHTSEPSNARKRGKSCPKAWAFPRAGARLPESRIEATPELLFLSKGNRRSVEAPLRTPRVLHPGESSVSYECKK
jgi:hypothetical protein